MSWCAIVAGAITFLCISSPPAHGQDKKDEKNSPPRVALITPLGVSAGATATVKIRGQRLADATAVTVPGAAHPVAATIKSKGKADVPQGSQAGDVGDTQVEVELAVPKDLPPGELRVVVATPAGDTEPHALLVTDPGTSADEKEGNGGFRQAQALSLPAVVRGRIENADDVDVFAFEGKSGRTVVAKVAAARHGSALDPLLTLYDARGSILATSDDTGPDPGAGEETEGRAAARRPGARANRDATLRFRCPSDGKYFLSLQDANGRGGAAHVYQVSLRVTD